jgi:hypothetical protein
MVNRIERVNRPSRPGRTAILIAAALAVTGLATYANIPAADGVIHGCYKRASGALRVIDDASGRCDANELPLAWSQSGLPGVQGPPGPSGPQGPEGPPGSAGSRLLATAAGAGFTSVTCSNTNETGPVHSVAFTKASEDSRLRISYADVADFLLTENELPRVEVRIDDNAITPAPFIVRFLPQDDSAPISSWEYAKQFATFGYADDVAAGPHTLTVIYTFPSFANTRACYRGYPDVTGAPFQIAIEEMP